MISKKDRIVVTGGNGFLGHAVCSELSAQGYESVVSFGSKEIDLTSQADTEHMYFLYDPAAVIHLAARVGGIGANMANPGKFAYENLAMGMNIIEGARKYNLGKLVIAGTVCAYPKMTPVPFKEESLFDGYPEETNAPYGLAKKMLLTLSQGYRKQYGINSVFLLPVNLYGPRDNFDLENSHVIPAMIRKFHEAKLCERDVTLWGDGTPTREFLYVDDCAKAFVAALERYDSPDPMNLGSGKEISMLSLAVKIQRIVGHKGKIIWDSSRPNGQPRRCLDTSKAEKEIGWSSNTEFDEGLMATYEWFRRQK